MLPTRVTLTSHATSHSSNEQFSSSRETHLLSCLVCLSLCVFVVSGDKHPCCWRGPDFRQYFWLLTVALWSAERVTGHLHSPPVMFECSILCVRVWECVCMCVCMCVRAVAYVYCLECWRNCLDVWLLCSSCSQTDRVYTHLGIASFTHKIPENWDPSICPSINK